MERVKVSEAAKLMGVSEQFIRVGLQRGILPIGHAVKLKQWVYYISKPMLEQYLGKKMPDSGNCRTDNLMADKNGLPT